MDLTTLIKNIIPSQDIVIGGKTVKSTGGIPVDVRVRFDPEFTKTILKGAAYIGTGIAVGMAFREFRKK